MGTRWPSPAAQRGFLFQVILRQVDRQLGDKGCATPVGPCTKRIDGGDVVRASGGLGTCEGVAVALVKVGVKVAQIECELLPGERQANVPISVALVGNAAREWRRACGSRKILGAIERIARSQE